MIRPAAAVLVIGLFTVPSAMADPALAQTPPASPPVESPRPAPAAAPQTPPATKPPAPRPRPRPSQSTAANLTMSVKVVDSTGAPLAGVRVTATGPVNRDSVTDQAGTVRFLSMRGGSYRLRFESPGTITLERDVVLARTSDPIEATLSAAPPPPPPPTPEPTRTDPIAGRGPVQAPQPRTVAIPEFVERNSRGRDPVKVSQLACGATSTTNLLQLREPLKDQVHPDAEALLYVVGGDGLLVLPIADVPLSAGTFSLVPRGTTYTLQRRGRNDLILLMSLTDTACEK